MTDRQTDRQTGIYCQANALGRLVASKNNGRQIVVLSNGIGDRKLVELALKDNGLVTDKWIDESGKEQSLSRKEIEKRSREYYLILWKNYDAATENWLRLNGYDEIKDYIFRVPKPITITGSIKDYVDVYGNTVNYLPGNLKIIFRGYLNQIVFGENVQFGSGSYFNLYCGNKIRISSGTLFGNNAVLLADNHAVCEIDRCIFGANMKIGMGDSSHIQVEKGGHFGEYNRLIANMMHEIYVGCDFLSSESVVVRSGDGHALFDVMTGCRRNFQIDEKANKTIIGNHVWITMGVKVLNPSRIGSGCTIGAGSVVKGNYPNNCVIAGSTAHVVRDNSAWAPYPMTEDMVGLCGNYYAIPTIYLNRVKDEKLKSLCTVTEIHDYLDILKKVKSCIIAMAVRDTAGSFIDERIDRELQYLGCRFSLAKTLWQAYSLVLVDGQVYFEQLKEEKDVAIEQEYDIEPVKIKVVSKPLHIGNKAEIWFNGFDYCVNSRGINIVVYDVDTCQVIDSVAFDCHVKELTCVRKIFVGESV